MPANVSTSSATHRTYTFGEFTLDIDRGALLRANRDIKLRPKSFEVLRYLVERPGLLISRDELLDAIWGQTIVTEDAVTQCLRDIRRALRDRSQTTIRTVPRRGYIFELPVTKHGGPVKESDAPSNGRPASRRPRWPLAAALALLLGVAAGWWGFEDRGVEIPATDVPYTVAVLPFLDMSPEQDQGYFADGISEEILNLLAWIPELRVIARTSSFSFKDRNVDIDTIADQLHVTHVLEGSVRRSGMQVRITAQLIDASDSTHVWSQTYDRELTAANLFHIQSEIGRAVTSQLKMALTEEQEQRLAVVPTDNMEAYTAYLIGRQRLADRKVKELGEAATQFAKAIELDPNFAGAYSGLADACSLYFGYSGGYAHEDCPAPSGESYRATVGQLARKAVELDEGLGEAWISLGVSLAGEAAAMDNEGAPATARVAKLKEAHAAFERGISLNPSHVQGHLWYAMSLANRVLYGDTWAGWLEAWKQDAWQSVIKRGLEIDPLSIPLHNSLAEYPMWARTEEEALAHARRTIEIAPDSPRGYERLGELSWFLSGRIDEAIRWENKSAEIDSQHPTYPAKIAYGYATLGDIEMALAYWEHAARIFADDSIPEDMYTLKAAIWLGAKGDLPVQRILEALEHVNPRNTDRLQAEAGLALIAGEATEWLARNTQHLSKCLEAEIDESYVDNFDCDALPDKVLMETGKQERAKTLIAQRIKFTQPWLDGWPYKDDFHREFSKHYAMLGNEHEALDYFEKLVKGGWRGNLFHHSPGILLRFFMYHDPALDAIRDHPRFQALVAEVEADLAQQLENVREMERKGELPTLEELRAELTTD